MCCGHSLSPLAGLSSVSLRLRWSLPPVEWFAFALNGEGRDLFRVYGIGFRLNGLHLLCMERDVIRYVERALLTT